MKTIEVVITHEQLTQGVVIGSTITLKTSEGLIQSHEFEITVIAPKSSELDAISDKATQEFREKYPE